MATMRDPISVEVLDCRDDESAPFVSVTFRDKELREQKAYLPPRLAIELHQDKRGSHEERPDRHQYRGQERQGDAHERAVLRRYRAVAACHLPQNGKVLSVWSPGTFP